MVNFSVSKQHEHWYDDVLLLHMIRANAESRFRLSKLSSLQNELKKKLFLSFIHHLTRRRRRRLLSRRVTVDHFISFMKLSDAFNMSNLHEIVFIILQIA